MKQVCWQLAIALLLTNAAMAAKSPAASCESHAVATYQKKAVEIEMSLIAGSKGEAEAGSERARLQKIFQNEKDNCGRLARNSASYKKAL